ncbi:MAG: hypothetical protein WDN72_00630 [Alphaproteobacteria bacterium]
MESLIKKELKSLDWLKEVKPADHLRHRRRLPRAGQAAYEEDRLPPLNIVHEYVMNRRAVGQLVEKLAEMSPQEISGLPGISAKRATTLVPTAARAAAIAAAKLRRRRSCSRSAASARVSSTTCSATRRSARTRCSPPPRTSRR